MIAIGVAIVVRPVVERSPGEAVSPSISVVGEIREERPNVLDVLAVPTLPRPTLGVQGHPLECLHHGFQSALCAKAEEMRGVGLSIMVIKKIAVFPMPPMGVNEVGPVVVHDRCSDPWRTAKKAGLGPATSVPPRLSAVEIETVACADRGPPPLLPATSAHSPSGSRLRFGASCRAHHWSGGPRSGRIARVAVRPRPLSPCPRTPHRRISPCRTPR